MAAVASLVSGCIFSSAHYVEKEDKPPCDMSGLTLPYNSIDPLQVMEKAPASLTAAEVLGAIENAVTTLHQRLSASAHLVTIKTGNARQEQSLVALTVKEDGTLLVPTYVDPSGVKSVEVRIGSVTVDASIIRADKFRQWTLVRPDYSNMADAPDIVILPFEDGGEVRMGRFYLCLTIGDQSSNYLKVPFFGFGLAQISSGARMQVHINGITPGATRTGSPVVDLEGRLVALSLGNNGLIAVSDLIDDVRAVLNGTIDDAPVIANKGGTDGKERWVGFSMYPLKKEYARSCGIPESSIGLSAIEMNSPAQKAGLTTDDVIVGVGAHTLSQPEGTVVQEFNRHYRVDIGEELKLKVVRDGVARDVVVVVGERAEREVHRSSFLGLTAGEIFGSDVIQHSLSCHEGVIITEIERGGAATATGSMARRFLGTSDVITEIDGKPVKSLSDFKAILEEIEKTGKKSVLVRAERGRRTVIVALNLTLGK